MFVCICNSVTDRDIRAAAERGLNTMGALQRELRVATCCGRCSDCARRLLAQALSDQRLPAPEPALA